MKIALTVALNILITVTVIITLIHLAQGAYPTSSLYNLQRLHEMITYTTQPSVEEKAEFQITLLQKRQSEIRRVFDEKKYQDLLATSLRYNATAGKASEIITQNNLTEQKKKLQELLKAHKGSFQTLKEKTPPTIVELSYIQDTLNYMEAYQAQLEAK